MEELLSHQDMPDSLRTVFLRLPELFGSLDQLSQVEAMVKNSRSRKAIERLKKVQTILESYGLADYVSYDLGMLSKYQYYTGIIFKAYTYGTGEYIVTGGRYDKLLVQFGKDVPAVGFAIVIDQLMLAMSRQKLGTETEPLHTLVLYEARNQHEAVALAKELRGQRKRTVLLRRSPGTSLKEYQHYAEDKGFLNMICVEEGTKTVVFDRTTRRDT